MSLKRAWWKKIAMAAMLAMGICLPSYGCSSGSGTLRVGVRADIQYWGYYNEKNGKYYGLEIDLARDLAKKLGYKDVASVC
jgi:putative glutamine transport system substrate-binding protein